MNKIDLGKIGQDEIIAEDSAGREQIPEPSVGTVQGSTLSPLLGNVYLHHVLDLWFAEEVKPRLRGKAILVRYADGTPVQA